MACTIDCKAPDLVPISGADSLIQALVATMSDVSGTNTLIKGHLDLFGGPPPQVSASTTSCNVNCNLPTPEQVLASVGRTPSSSIKGGSTLPNPDDLAAWTGAPKSTVTSTSIQPLAPANVQADPQLPSAEQVEASIKAQGQGQPVPTATTPSTIQPEHASGVREVLVDFGFLAVLALVYTVAVLFQQGRLWSSLFWWARLIALLSAWAVTVVLFGVAAGWFVAVPLLLLVHRKRFGRWWETYGPGIGRRLSGSGEGASVKVEASDPDGGAARRWAAERPWFTSHQRARALAYAVTEELAGLGYPAEAQLYWADQEVRKRFPELFA